MQWLRTSYMELFVVFHTVNGAFYSNACKLMQRRTRWPLVQQRAPALKWFHLNRHCRHQAQEGEENAEAEGAGWQDVQLQHDLLMQFKGKINGEKDLEKEWGRDKMGLNKTITRKEREMEQAISTPGAVMLLCDLWAAVGPSFTFYSCSLRCRTLL